MINIQSFRRRLGHIEGMAASSMLRSLLEWGSEPVNRKVTALMPALILFTEGFFQGSLPIHVHNFGIGDCK